MKLMKLDPNVPYENYMIKAIREGKKDPVKFHKRVQGIIREAQENACRIIGIPIDTKFDLRLIAATTEDGIIFYTRADLLIYPGLKLDLWMKDNLI